MNNDSAIRSHYEGDRISGLYFGVRFAGIVTKDRRNTCSGAHEMFVTLDTPTVVMGDERKVLLIDTHMTYRQLTLD